MAENNSWDHPFQVGDKTEPIQSFEAFQIWLEMGSKRNLKVVAERVEKSYDTIKKYSCTWKWSERLQDKLTYENSQIHGKQLESILYNLDLDNKRDVLIQQSLGNLANTIFNITLSTKLGNSVSDLQKKENKLINPSLPYLERILTIYSKLEKLHDEHQKKYISLNKECLQYSNFDKQEKYAEVIINGDKNHRKIWRDIHKEHRKMLKEEDLNYGALAIMNAPPFLPVEPYKSSSVEVAGDVKKLED